MNEVTVNELDSRLEQAKIFKNEAQTRVIALAQVLYEIKAKQLWRAKYTSFSECLLELDMSDSSASKIISVFQRYCIDGGFSLAKIAPVDAEKLYLATRLPYPVERQLASASTLSRRELKDLLAEKEGVECTHEETIRICTRCHKRTSETSQEGGNH